MARKVQIGLILILVLFTACKKSEDRSCWKGHGEESTLEIPITDSVHTWYLKKGIKYRIFQDSTRRVVIKGGENMINHVETTHEGTDYTIKNNNRCNFLRTPDRFVEVEIHYPYMGTFFIEPSDSVVFMDTIVTDSIRVELAFGGGSMLLNVDTDFINVVVSRGTADYKLGGTAYHAEVKVQDRGFADATEFTAVTTFAYQNSTADLHINMEGSAMLVQIDGTGDVYAIGTPTQMTTIFNGSGELLEY